MQANKWFSLTWQATTLIGRTNTNVCVKIDFNLIRSTKIAVIYLFIYFSWSTLIWLLGLSKPLSSVIKFLRTCSFGNSWFAMNEIPGVLTVMHTYLLPHPLRDWMEHRIEFESQSSVFCSLLQTDKPLLCPLEFCQCLGSKEITETNPLRGTS